MDEKAIKKEIRKWSKSAKEHEELGTLHLGASRIQKIIVRKYKVLLRTGVWPEDKIPE